MKILLLALLLLAVIPAGAADSAPFAPTPFQLQPPSPPQPAGLGLVIPRPFVIDYGVELSAFAEPPRTYRFLDAPGPGYRLQRAHSETRSPVPIPNIIR
jgi:hypothetical protein